MLQYDPMQGLIIGHAPGGPTEKETRICEKCGATWETFAGLVGGSCPSCGYNPSLIVLPDDPGDIDQHQPPPYMLFDRIPLTSENLVIGGVGIGVVLILLLRK